MITLGEHFLRNGLSCVITDNNKAGMSIFKVFGTVDNKSCFWTEQGTYRMDNKEHDWDIV